MEHSVKFGVELVYYCTGLDTTCSYRSVNMLMERVLSRPGMRCEHAVRLQVRGSFLSRPRLAHCGSAVHATAAAGLALGVTDLAFPKNFHAHLFMLST